MKHWTPTSVRASKASLDFVFNPDIPTGEDGPISLTLFKNTKFRSTLDGKSYIFVTNKTSTIPRTTGENPYTLYDCEIIEGRILNKSYTVNGADDSQRFIIPNAGVDTTTITVTVQKTSIDSEVETFINGK